MLATPLTVCLVVMGRHIPRLSFLGVLLSDEEALTPAEDCYYRLLTVGDQDESELAEAYLKANSMTALYDAVFVPVITRMEMDYRMELLDEEQRMMVEQSLTDLIQDVGTRAQIARNAEKTTSTQVAKNEKPLSVFCVPARASRDELAATMLAQLLRQENIEVETASAKLEADELVKLVEPAGTDVICISVVSPSTVLHARYLCLKLRAKFRSERIVVGLWGFADGNTDAIRRVRESGADQVVTTFAEAVTEMQSAKQPHEELAVM